MGGQQKLRGQAALRTAEIAYWSAQPARRNARAAGFFLDAGNRLVLLNDVVLDAIELIQRLLPVVGDHGALCRIIAGREIGRQSIDLALQRVGKHLRPLKRIARGLHSLSPRLLRLWAGLGLRLVRRRGWLGSRVCLTGVHKEAATVDLVMLLAKEIAIIPAMGYGGEFEEVGAHVVFRLVRPLAIGRVKLVQVFPLHKIIRREQIQMIS